MVIAFPPENIIEWLGVSPKKFFLGSKEEEESLWKIWDSLEKGGQKGLQAKTAKKLRERIEKKLPDLTLLDKLDTLNDKGLRPWEAIVRASNLASRNRPLVTLEAEAIRLERLAVPIKAAVARSDFRAAYELIEKADMPSFPCLSMIISQIEYEGPKDRLIQTTLPLAVATTLYLLACAEADRSDDGEVMSERLIPEIRNGELFRPMRLWLEAVKANYGLRTQKKISEFLLKARDDEQDYEERMKREKTRLRELRKWWSGREFPSWTRVPTMALAVSRATKQNSPENTSEIAKEIRIGLGIVRILDGLMVQSILAQNLFLPDYDPWGPFRDYPLMLSHAREVKAGLSA